MIRVLITRPRHQAGEFAARLQNAGFEPVYFPVITIGALPDPVQLDFALQQLNHFDWLILTSANGVAAVWERLGMLGIHRLPERLKIAAIGPNTAGALIKRGITPDFVPKEFVAEAIVPGLGDLQGRAALLPRADRARADLAIAIRKAGGTAHEVTAYLTLPDVPDANSIKALRSGVDVITFTSSSTVRNFISLAAAAGLDARHLPGKPLIACIGPITAATAREEGFKVDVVAAEYTTQGMVEALSRVFSLPEQEGNH